MIQRNIWACVYDMSKNRTLRFPKHKHNIAQSAGAVEFSDCFSEEEYPHPTSVPVMTLNDLMVRLQ